MGQEAHASFFFTTAHFSKVQVLYAAIETCTSKIEQLEIQKMCGIIQDLLDASANFKADQGTHVCLRNRISKTQILLFDAEILYSKYRNTLFYK